MKNQWVLRIIVLSILWVGLGVLSIGDKVNEQIVWQAVIFSILVLGGLVLEKMLDYRGDGFLLPAVQAVLVIGLVFLVRISSEAGLRQFWWANLGLSVFYAVLWGVRDYRRFGRFQYMWGLGAVALLLLTFLFGSESGGAISWFRFGNMGFQPEEFVKIALLLFLSVYLMEREELLRVGTVQWGPVSLPDWRTLGPFLVMAGFSLGLLAAQKSLGTALVFYSLFVMMFYVVTERAIYLGISLPMIALTGWLGYNLFGHVRVRVSTWLNPWVDATGGGYQIAQSLFAISGGNVLGTGLNNGIGAYQVPASSTDFIFSVIAEELGFAGAIAILCLFLVIILRAFAVSQQAKDRFGQTLAAGIGLLIAIETLIILAGVTKLLPLTGIPLPWASLGGNSLLVHFILLGLLTNISHASASHTQDMEMKGKECAG